MNNSDKNNSEESDRREQAAPAVKRVAGRAGFSPIWIVPLVALVIGAYLIYRVVTESGPQITITFEEAPGVEAGKTKIKYKDIIVGEVTEVDISDDIKSVNVTAEMSPKAKKYLTDKAKFWVVSPQFSSGTISGLGTLFSGNYISMEPSLEGARAKSFTGLKRPPVVHSSESGSSYKLRARRLGGVSFGSPVYYKDIPVGKVVEYTLQEDDTLVVEVFVRAPYDRRVNEATRFWNTSGFNVSLSANGLEVDTESLVSILIGGIAFGTVPHVGNDASKPPAKDQVFNLYASRGKSREPVFHDKRRVLLYFRDSIRGLIPGAPVEMRGYQIGEVVDVGMDYNSETREFRLPVLIDIEPERLQMGKSGDFETTLAVLVKRGLRGQLKSGNLVLGKLLVELDFHQDVPQASLDITGKYPVLPTIPDTSATIIENAGALVTELRQTANAINGLLASADFKQGAADLGSTIANINRLTAELERSLAPELSGVLSAARATLADAQSMLATNSTTRTELDRLLAELTEAARSIRLLADYLEQYPESIIKGKD